MNTFIKGMDLSTLPEVERCGGKFYDNGKPATPFPILKSYGMNLVRLRLWNDPYSEDGVPYGAGTNDLPRTVAMAKRLKAAGVDWMLDLHYSDFWADPGKRPPKAGGEWSRRRWPGAVYDFTFSVMTTLASSGLLPTITAVGNELSNGCCGLTAERPILKTSCCS